MVSLVLACKFCQHVPFFMGMRELRGGFKTKEIFLFFYLSEVTGNAKDQDSKRKWVYWVPSKESQRASFFKIPPMPTHT